MDLEEVLQDIPVAGDRRVEDNLDSLGVRAVIAVGGIGNIAAGVTDTCRDDARLLANEILHAPEASTRENCALMHIKPP